MGTQTARYALRILGHLAERPGEWARCDELAATTGIPANYLSKILNQLRKHGIVQSHKGWGGGFCLPPASMRVSVLEVLQLFDGLHEDLGCAFGLLGRDATLPCPLHARWETLHRSYTDMLSATTLADLSTTVPAVERDA